MSKDEIRRASEDTRGKTEKVKKHVAKIIDNALPGDRITPELKLADSLKVSHSTVRRALDELVDAGLLRRKHGSGTFVNFKKLDSMKTKTALPLENFFNHRSPFPTSKKRHELKFYTYEGPREIAIYQRLIQDFEYENPNFHMKLEPWPVNVNLPAYFYDIEDGHPPEMFYLNQSHLFWLIKNEFIHPLDEALEVPGIFDNLDPFVKRAITYQNKTWVMPKNLNVFHLVYNKKIFDARGIAYPNATWTWEDYLNAAREITGPSDDGKSQWFGTVPHRDYLYLTLLAWALGGELVDSSGKIQLESDASMEALKFAVDLTLKHKVTIRPEDWTYWKDANSTKDILPFQQGILGMWIRPGTDLSDDLLTPGLEFGIAPIPTGPNGRHIPLLYSAWAMTTNSPCPTICANFLKRIGIDGNAPFARNNLSAFVTRENLESYLTPDKPSNAFDILVMKNHLREFPFHGHFWPFLMGYIDEMFKAIFLRNAPIKKSVRETANMMRAAMDQFMKWIEKDSF